MSGFDFDDIIIGQPQSHAQPQPVAPAPVKTISPPTRPPADSEFWAQCAEPKLPQRSGVHPAWAMLLAFLIVHLTKAIEEFDGVKPSIGGEFNDLIPKQEK